MPKLPGDSSLVGCIQKITKNKPWVFKKRTLSLKHKPRAISYHLMNKPTIVKKQKCEWKNISNPHTSLWKKSVTFTFVVAGTSISALCSVLADGRKRKTTRLSVGCVYCHDYISTVALCGAGQVLNRVNITSSVPGNECHITSDCSRCGTHNTAASNKPFPKRQCSQSNTLALRDIWVIGDVFVVVTLSWLVSFYANHRKNRCNLSDA